MADVNCMLTFNNDHEAEYADDQQFYGTQKVTGRVGGDELGRRTVAKLNEWVQKYSEQCHRGELSLLGYHLYRIAFDTPPDPPVAAAARPLKSAFETTFRQFGEILQKDPQKRMRMKLVFKKEAEKLSGLPWEFLCMPQGEQGIFLAAQQTELILTRFVPEEPWGKLLQPDEGNEKLRILVVTVQPRELDDVRDKNLIEEIQKLKTEHIDVKVFDKRPTLSSLRECISGSDENRGYRPHIVHFMGHGRAGELALVKEENQLRMEESDAEMRRGRDGFSAPVEEAQWLDMESVKSLFIGHKPRVVFLHACQGAAPDSLKTFSSTARELAYSNIPAVIAMQYQIGNDEAELFAKTFYRQLRQGKHVDEAVTEARRQLGLFPVKPGRNVWDDRSFGTPVIYLQTEKPIILPPPTATKPVVLEPPGDTNPAAITAPRKVPCPNPECTGLVIEGRSMCLKCMKAVMLCSQCGVMMLKELGICDNGHRLDLAVSSQTPATERSGFESSPERKRLII